MPCTNCHCLPEIATGAKRPRNDTSGGTALTTVHPIDLAVLLPLRGQAGHAPPLQTHQCRPIPNFSFLIPNIINKAAPHHSARAFVERFFVEARFEKCRRALCTSSFSNRRIGEKYPTKAEGAIVRCCPYLMRLVALMVTSMSASRASTFFFSSGSRSPSGIRGRPASKPKQLRTYLKTSCQCGSLLL